MIVQNSLKNILVIRCLVTCYYWEPTYYLLGKCLINKLRLKSILYRNVYTDQHPSSKNTLLLYFVSFLTVCTTLTITNNQQRQNCLQELTSWKRGWIGIWRRRRILSRHIPGEVYWDLCSRWAIPISFRPVKIVRRKWKLQLSALRRCQPNIVTGQIVSHPPHNCGKFDITPTVCAQSSLVLFYCLVAVRNIRIHVCAVPCNSTPKRDEKL